MANAVQGLGDLLSSITARLDALESKAGISSGAAPATGGTAPAASTEVAPFVAAFDEFVGSTVNPFVATSNAIGGKAASLGGCVKDAFNGMREFLNCASQSKKPADADVMSLASFKAMQAAMKAANNLKGRDEFENHAKAVCEGFGAVAWVCPGIGPPRPYVETMAEASMFWANKVRVAFKKKEGGDSHLKWCTELNALWVGLEAYVKAHHTAGVSWNPRGGDAKAFSGGAAPTPAPAAPPKPAAAPTISGGGGGGLGSVFSQLKKIDQSSGKTAGLKHVTKDMKSKNQSQTGGSVPAKPKTAPAKKWGQGGGVATAKKDPVFKLAGNKWQIEHQTGMVTLEADKVSIKQSVYIYGCQGATILVNGKVNSITVDGCKKTKVLFENVLASFEVVNCKSLQIQVKGTAPTVSIDKTDGILLYLSREAVEVTKIVTSKSSEMNVSFPGKTDDDDYVEMPIPEQFVHKVTASGITSDISDLYSH